MFNLRKGAITMKLNTHQDMENQAYAGILTTLFPEQTKTLPRIIVWSIIFMLDLILGVVGAIHFGLLQLDKFNSMSQMMLGAGLLIVAIVGVFWLQGVIWFAVVKLCKKKA